MMVDVYKNIFKKYSPTQNLMHSFVAGSMGGITASAATYPLELVRTRIAGMVTPTERGIWRTFIGIIRREGFLGLYKGLSPTLIGAMPFEGVLIVQGCIYIELTKSAGSIWGI
eukprot:m.112690 g.112690  ORF g.112690 m.112690 type:complete len:113 (-) comp14097_c0_seq7:2743-3081(-)